MSVDARPRPDAGPVPPVSLTIDAAAGRLVAATNGTSGSWPTSTGCTRTRRLSPPPGERTTARPSTGSRAARARWVRAA